MGKLMKIEIRDGKIESVEANFEVTYIVIYHDDVKNMAEHFSSPILKMGRDLRDRYRFIRRRYKEPNWLLGDKDKRQLY